MGACRDFCVGFAKCIIIFLNVLVLISAISLITTAAVYKSQATGLDVKGLSTFAIVLGVFIGIIALFGCCGAIRENSCMLTVYAGILLAFFIIQLILAILAFAAATNGEADIKEQVTTHLTALYNSSRSEDRETINNLQIGLQCCGLNGPNGTEVQIATGVLKSCCDSSVPLCTEEKAYKDGCVKDLTAIFIGSLFATGITAIFFAIIELIVAIFAFCVRGNIKRDREMLA